MPDMPDPVAAAVDGLQNILFLSQELTDVVANAEALFLTLTSAAAAAAAVLLILTMVALGMSPSAAARPGIGWPAHWHSLPPRPP